MQLAVKVQGEIDPGTGLPEELAEGTGVFFWKKGKILDQHGIEHDTWWLVDNGVIGADGMARTSSPPYTDVSGSGGVFTVTTSDYNEDTGELKVSGAVVNFHAIWAQTAFMALVPASSMPLAAVGAFTPFAVVPLNYTRMGTLRLTSQYLRKNLRKHYLISRRLHLM